LSQQFDVLRGEYLGGDAPAGDAVRLAGIDESELLAIAQPDAAVGGEVDRLERFRFA